MIYPDVRFLQISFCKDSSQTKSHSTQRKNTLSELDISLPKLCPNANYNLIDMQLTSVLINNVLELNIKGWGYK